MFQIKLNVLECSGVLDSLHFDKGLRVADGKTVEENDLKGKRSLRVSLRGLTSVESSRVQVIEVNNYSKCMKLILV